MADATAEEEMLTETDGEPLTWAEGEGRVVPDTVSDFDCVPVRDCVQVRKSVDVDVAEGATDGDVLIVPVRDTSVLEPVLDTVFVLLCIVEADRVAVTRLLLLGRTVTDVVTELVLVLLGLEEEESQGEAVVVLDTDVEPVTVLVTAGLRDLTEAVAVGDPVTRELILRAALGLRIVDDV